MDTRTALALFVTAVAAIIGCSPASAAARIAQSGRYICNDGSSVRFDRRGYGPTLIRDGREVHLRQRWVFFGFRFTGQGINLRGRGTQGEKTLTLTESSQPSIECAAAPAAATPGIVTGRLIAADPVFVPPGARLLVQLHDVARTDAAAPLLGQLEIRPGRRQLPLAFILRYSVAGPTSPALSARLFTADGKLLASAVTSTPLPKPERGRNTDAEISLRAVPSPSNR